MSRGLSLLLAAPEEPKAPAKPWSVVIVDDTEDLRFILRRLLSTNGKFHIAGEAENGRQAIEVARATQPDLLLLDLLMPVMDGWEALPRIREVSPRTRIVVVSGQDRTLMEPKALQMGAFAYIEKGVSTAEILRGLLRVMER